MNRCIIRASAKALRSAVLVVPVVLDDAEVAVARPDHRQHQHLALLLRVAEVLELLCVREDIVWQVREPVQIEQHLAVGLFLQRREQGIAAQLDMGILLGLPATEELLAGRIVLQIEGVGLAWAALRLLALDRHAAGDEVHRASPSAGQGFSRERTASRYASDVASNGQSRGDRGRLRMTVRTASRSRRSSSEGYASFRVEHGRYLAGDSMSKL
ncbi:MAG: hypothetical protein ACK5ZQ_02975 [bacterium]